MIDYMQVDPRLNDIDDCLYRVAARVLIVHNGKVLLVKEAVDAWWAIPGGGVDHGEAIETAALREVEEELGVPTGHIVSDFKIVHYNIGNVVKGIPRMNLFFKASVPQELLGESDHVAEWQWFVKDEFLKLNIHPSYDKAALADIIFEEER